MDLRKQKNELQMEFNRYRTLPDKIGRFLIQPVVGYKPV
jgi:hypothetical protein